MSHRLDMRKFVRIVGMLGSAHDGEVVAAARQASRMLSEARVSWSEVIKSPPIIKDVYQREYMRRRREAARGGGTAGPGGD